jgi:hypothetical protein
MPGTLSDLMDFKHKQGDLCPDSLCIRSLLIDLDTDQDPNMQHHPPACTLVTPRCLCIAVAVVGMYEAVLQGYCWT